MISVERTPLSGVLVITPRRFNDGRGFFSETWSQRHLAKAGIDVELRARQPFVSRDRRHRARPAFPGAAPCAGQAGALRPRALFDVAVDIRRGSPTYGQWDGIELTAENGRQLLIPKGFLHGFVTLVPDTEIVYKCSDFYAPETERSAGTTVGIGGRKHAARPVGQGCRRTAPCRFHLAFVFQDRHEDAVTGGAGFIGSAVVRLAVARGHAVVNLDALTYAACLDNVATVAGSPLYAFEQADIRDRAALDAASCRRIARMR